MNAAERQPYMDQVEAEYTAYVLGEQRGYQILCSWCKYFEYSPPTFEESYGEALCEHPIAKVREKVSESVMSDASDCWAFRIKAGAKEKLARSYNDGPPVSAGGPRLVELIEMGSEKRAELMDAYWKNWQPRVIPRLLETPA